MMPFLRLYSTIAFLLIFSFSIGQPCPDQLGYGETCSDPIDLCTGSIPISTCGYEPEPPLIFCGGAAGAHNSVYIEFVAGSDSVSFDFSIHSCVMGLGVQAVIYKAIAGDCNNLVELACFNPPGVPQDFTISANLVPGQTYLLMVDGFAGDCCNVDVVHYGVDQNPAPPPTPIIDGPLIVCEGDSAVYKVVNSGSGPIYVWNNNAQFIDSTGREVTIDFSGQTENVELCVQASVPCNPSCSCIEIEIEKALSPGPLPGSFCLIDDGGDTILPLDIRLHLDSLFADHQSGYKYTWYPNITALQEGTPVVSPIISETGTHSFYYSVLSDVGCNHIPVEQPLTITVHEPDLQSSIEIERSGSFYELTSIVIGTYDTLYWEASNGWTSSENDPNIPIDFTGEVAICLFVENACMKEVSCETVFINPDSIIVVKEDSDDLPPGPNTGDGNIIDDRVNHPNLLIYPNPAEQNIQVRSDIPISAYKVYDSQAIEILHHDFTSNSTAYSLDTTGYSPGVYYLKSFSQEGAIIQSFVIVR